MTLSTVCVHSGILPAVRLVILLQPYDPEYKIEYFHSKPSHWWIIQPTVGLC